jgi:PAS domain-containing protein
MEDAGTAVSSDGAGADGAEVRRAAELTAIIESIPDGVFIGTARGVSTANVTALRHLGYPSVEALNRDRSILQRALDARDAETGRPDRTGHDPFGRALAGERAVRELIIRHRETARTGCSAWPPRRCAWAAGSSAPSR